MEIKRDESNTFFLTLNGIELLSILTMARVCLYGGWNPDKVNAITTTRYDHEIVKEGVNIWYQLEKEI